MSDQVWYLYQNGQQLGPYDTQQVTQLFTTKMIADDGYIFKVGWKDWRPVEEGYEVLGLTVPSDKGWTDEQLNARKAARPRAGVTGRVVVHNNGDVTIGKGINVSETGIFVETHDRIFTLGEQLKISVRCDGLSKAFNAEAIVIRFNTDPRYPLGYGLQFTSIDDSDKVQIRELVEQLNKSGNFGLLAK
jgi:hypothetical protein